MSEVEARLSPGRTVGVTEDMIEDVILAFYSRVREDGILGPIFNPVIDDWDAHHAKICHFWSSVVLLSGRYKGTPMPVHTRLDGISSEHFDRWLALFRETAQQICPPDAAALFVDRANRIAQSLELGVATHRGQMLCIGERLKSSEPVTAKAE